MSPEQTGPYYVRHELKIWPQYYDAVQSGERTFEIRKDDRNFEVGNILLLREYDPNSEEFTGREMAKRIRCIIRGFEGIHSDYAALGIGNL